MTRSSEKSSRLQLLNGCPFLPSVDAGRSEDTGVGAESSEDTGPSRWCVNSDQEKERGRSRGAEQRMLVRKSDDLDTSNHSATNLLCVLREVMSTLLGVCQPPDPYTGQCSLGTEMRFLLVPKFCGPHTVNSTQTQSLFPKVRRRVHGPKNSRIHQ